MKAGPEGSMEDLKSPFREMAALFIRNWLWIAIVMGPALAILPLMLQKMPVPVLLIFLLSPAYMFHQIEEHWRDRFRLFVNQRVFGGVEALTPAAVFWINVPIVWGIDAGALISAAFGRFELALLAFYMMLVNAVVHTVGIFRFGYNPGLVTSVIIFIPLSCAGLVTSSQPLVTHLIALGLAVIGHGLIFGYALSRVLRLRRA
jgi:hypothetical protein